MWGSYSCHLALATPGYTSIKLLQTVHIEAIAKARAGAEAGAGTDATKGARAGAGAGAEADAMCARR